MPSELGTSAADSIQTLTHPVVMFSNVYENGFCTELHAHTRIQLLFANSGTMKAQTKMGAWIIPSGYALVIPAKLPHTVKMFGEVNAHSVYISEGLLAEHICRSCNVIHVSSLLRACINRLARRPHGYELGDFSYHLAQIIILEISHTKPSGLNLPFPSSDKLKIVCDIIQRDVATSRNLDDWAKSAAMSRRNFTRLFRKETGMSFDQWRQRLRFHVASQHLANGASMQQVAARVGYSSASALRAMIGRHL